MLKIKGKYNNDINRTKNCLKIKSKIEKLGHTGIEVWYERPCGSVEMEGTQGGYFFISNEHNDLEPLGLSLNEVFSYIDLIVEEVSNEKMAH